MRKIVKFSNGDKVGVDGKRLETLVKTDSVNILIAEYLLPITDANGNDVKINVVEVDGKPWPPAKSPSPTLNK